MVHVFEVEVAEKYGVNAAILLHNLFYWCEHNRANGKCFHDGYYWTFNSAKAFTTLFPYMSEYQVRSSIQKLVDDGLVITGNYNQSAYDRTTWYAVTISGASMLKNLKMDEENNQNGRGQNSTPIPDIKPDINTDSSGGEIGNPFGDYDDSPPPRTVESYVSGFLRVFTPTNIDELETFLHKDGVPEDVVKYAVDEAVKAKAPAWKYVRSILMRYLDSGCTTLDEFRQAGRRRPAQEQRQPEDDNPLLRAKFY